MRRPTRAARVLLLAALVLHAACAHATRFDVAALMEGAWRADVGGGGCRLVRTVPGVGDAMFARSGARPERFELRLRAPAPAGSVQATIEAPPWHRDYPSDEHLARADVGPDGRTLALSPAAAQALRAGLARGLAGVFAGDSAPQRAWAVPGSGFADAHARYARCVARLPPPNEQAARLAHVARPLRAARKIRARVRFAEQSAVLTAQARRALEDVLARYRAAGAVRRVAIAGYSDDGGDFAHNIDLSRRRAHEVAVFLMARGVPASKLGIRYFGDHYPVADSLDADGRAENRRATVQLER